jgi:hypothetical protein
MKLVVVHEDSTFYKLSYNKNNLSGMLNNIKRLIENNKKKKYHITSLEIILSE